MILRDFVGNIALLIMLCMAQRFLVERWRGSDLGGQVVSGLLFGAAGAIGMMLAVTLAPGIIFDARNVVLSVASALGGPVVGVTAGAVMMATRLWIGGAGSLVGVVVMATAVVAGVAFHRHYRGRAQAPGVGAFLLLGLIVHALPLGLFSLLPVDFEEQILGRLALPYIGTLVPATAALALALQQVEAFARFDRVLEASEDRFRGLVDTAAVAIFEEDLSDVVRRLEELRAAGVTDIRAHAAAHPALLDEMLAAIRVVRVNPAGLRMFGAASESDLLSGIGRTFTPAARTVLVDLLAALWERQPTFTAEAPFQTMDGRPITTILSIPLPADEEAARRVPVSFVDVSEHKAMASRLAEERQRLSEIIWGTNAGTWEWNVQTGAVVFNERWAEIVGYTLAELEPISIATWERLAHADDLARSEAQLQEVFAGTRDYYEIEVRMHHKSGSIVWVLDRGKVTERDAEGRPVRMSGTHTDITDRKTAEETADRVAAVRELIVRCDGVILRETDEQAMLARLVQLLVESRGYAVAWIGVPQNDAERTVKPIAWAGEAARYIDHLTVHWSDDAAGQGPTGRAIRSGTPQTSNDIARDPAMGFWTDLAAQAGLRSCMAIPVPDRSGVAAVLVVYSDRIGRFGEEEANLLVEFAANLGLAIQTRRAEAERERFRLQFDRAAIGAINAVSATIEKRDPCTSGHQERVSRLAVAIATELGWDAGRIEGLRLGAMIHDIGKIYVPAEILNRPGRLSEAEFTIIKAHPQVGYEILEKSEFPWPIKEMVRQHHERPDGSGYPLGLKGDEIIAEAKIIAVADVLESMTAHRPYRPSLGLERAMAEIEAGSGTRYDPEIAAVCLRLVREGRFRWDTEPQAA